MKTTKAATPSGLLDRTGRSIPHSTIDRIRAQANWGNAYEAAGKGGTFLGGWNPWLRSADADWLGARDLAVARTRDLSRNDPVASSAGARKINAAVGSGWRLSSRVNARALGISNEAAGNLRSQIQTAFRHYAEGYSFQADAERKKTFGQILRMSAAHLFHDGEALAVVEWAGDESTKFKTRLRVVDPDRLSNPLGKTDSATLRRGVERSPAGVPTGYYIREGHPSDVGLMQNFRWRLWKRYSTPLGRPQVLHCFDELRAGQSRGVSRFVAVLKSIRAFQKFNDNTLEKSALAAMWLAFVKSSAGPEAVSESLSAEDLTEFDAGRVEHYKDNPIELGGVTLPVLPFGDEIEASPIGTDTTGFDAYVRSVLRIIAAALGVTYEELSMDFSQTNYSSARAALAIAWNETLAFRSILAAQVATPFFVAWLEEAIDIGVVVIPSGAPDFYDAIEAYSQCVWIGPARGYIDPTKEIDAASARVEAFMSTDEAENAEQGNDWEETYDQLAHERDRRIELKLPKIDTGLRLAAPDVVTQQEQNNQRDERPSALATVHARARSAEHAATLDRKGAAS